MHCDFSTSKVQPSGNVSQMFRHLNVNFLNLKVKVQGQNRDTEKREKCSAFNITAITLYRSWQFYVSNLGVKYD